MSIILFDLDDTIISFMDLAEMVNLMQTNKNYYEKIKQQTLIKEWNEMKHLKCDLNGIFKQTCKNKYITYAKSLIHRYNADICVTDKYLYIPTFNYACEKDYLEITKQEPSKPTIILYWSSMCPFSKKIKPEWDKFKNVFAKNFSSLQIAELNVAFDEELMNIVIKEDVFLYPSIILFINGDKYFMVGGNRTAEEINDFVTEILNKN